MSAHGPRGELRALLYGRGAHKRRKAPEPDLLIVLAEHLSREVLMLALLAVAAPPWPRLKARSLLRQQVLAALAQRLDDTFTGIDTWNAVVPELASFLPPALHEKALATANNATDEEVRVRVIAGLAVAVDDPARAAALGRFAWQRAGSVRDERRRAELLAAVDDLLAAPEPGLADPSGKAVAAAASAVALLPALAERDRDDVLRTLVRDIGRRLGGVQISLVAAEPELEEADDATAWDGEESAWGDAEGTVEVETEAEDATATEAEPEYEEDDAAPADPAKPAWEDLQAFPSEQAWEGPEAASEAPPEPAWEELQPAPGPVSASAGRRLRRAARALPRPRLVRARRPEQEQIVNTGFASRRRPARFLPRHVTLQPSREYWFCVEIGRPLARSLERSRLPVEHLPKQARLFVAVFCFPGELGVDPEHDGGELQLLASGLVVVRQQPMLELARVPPELVSRRLFFPIRTPRRSGRFRLRLNIYSAGMLVQSRLVTAQVTAVRLLRPWALRGQLEYTISRAIEPATLAELPPHKLSLMLNGPGDGSHTFRVLAEDGQERIKTDCDFAGGELTDLITTARGTLREVSWGDSDEWAKGKTFRYGDGGLELDKVRLDLARLAVSGYRIYTLLVDGFRGLTTRADFERLLAAPGYVQLAAQDGRMLVPLSLVYDYAPFDDTAPLESYTLCDVFTRALATPKDVETFSCLDGACPNRGRDTVVCPSGFWGYRHFIGLPLSSTLDVQPFLTYERPPRLVFGSAADLDRRADHEAKLSRLGATMTSGHTRAALLERLRSDSAQLVYLYCHGGLDGTQPYLLVGSGTDGPITRAYLYGRVDWQNARPLVVINGCHTIAIRPDQAFDLVSGLIQQASAIGVVGTEVTIGEALACAFGEEFIRRFAIANETVGEAIRNTRLELLGRGNPLGLVYTAFALAGLRMTGG